MGHSETVTFLDPLLSGIGEMSLAVIRVKVHPGEITDNDQVHIAVTIAISERRTVTSAPALFGEAGRLRRVGEAAVPVIEQQPGWVAVVSVKIGGRHLAALVRHFILRQPDIEIAVAVNVTVREHLRVSQLRGGGPDQLAGFRERALP